MSIVDKDTGHCWERVNLVTIKDRSGLYDLYQCSNCGKKYKRFGLAWNPPQTKCKPKKKD